MELIVFMLCVGLLITAVILSGKANGKDLLIACREIRSLKAAVASLEESAEEDDGELVEKEDVWTHRITDGGRWFYVRKCAPGYGVDADGKRWPLFIAPGRANYRITRI